MASVSQRTWRVPGQRTKRKAWGYTFVDQEGKQRRCYKAEWSKEEAETALATVLSAAPKKKLAGEMTLGEALDRFLATRSRRGNPRSKNDGWTVARLKTALGAETPLAEITASRISEYKAGRLASGARSAAAVNRPLAMLRHVLRLAAEEWEVIAEAPRVRLEREPQGRIRWLEPAEEARLLDACRKSAFPLLAGIVLVALESGMRKSEILNLTWGDVDLSRGVIRLEVTKSGKRREVPMRQKVYDLLATMPVPAVAGSGARQGRVWSARSIRSAFESAVEAAGLGDFHFHDLRHSFASWFVMRGGSIVALQEILGHASLAMTRKYSHLSPDHLRAEMEKTEQPAAPAIAHALAHEPVAVVSAEGRE